jgi:hypothetical protein
MIYLERATNGKETIVHVKLFVIVLYAIEVILKKR